MYKRLSAVMFPIVSVLLIGAVVWGYQENQDKNSILIKAENQYQRAFHDLSYHLDRLHTELGSTIAVNSASHAFQRKGLVNVWRLTSEAQSEINQLPLTLLPFSKTEEFLSNMANFSYRASLRDLTKQPLSKEEMNTMKTLYDRSKQISNEIRNVQTKVIDKNLRWMDVEVAIASENKTMDNTIIDGFKTVDKRVGEYSEVEWGPSMATLYEPRNFQALSGPNMNTSEIRKKALQFLGWRQAVELTVKENGNGTEYNTYSVTARKSQKQEPIRMDFTKKGGEIVWLMNSRPTGKKLLSVEDAGDAALDFLNEHHYSGMKAVSYDEYQNVASLTFAKETNGVIVYPEKLTVKVALDDGTVLGLQATDYVFEHNKKRTIKSPKLTLQQAKKALNPNFAVAGHDLALIDNELNQEVLCYQFLGKINGTNYRIYINADNGYEEKVEVIKPAEAKVAKA